MFVLGFFGIFECSERCWGLILRIFRFILGSLGGFFWSVFVWGFWLIFLEFGVFFFRELGCFGVYLGLFWAYLAVF